MKVKGEYEEYFGATISVYGTLPVKTFSAAIKYVSDRLENKKLNIFKFGTEEVGYVGFVPGGGNDAEWLQEAYDLGVRTYITGCTNRCKHPYAKAKTKRFLAKAKELKLNIIGASHYLTEKWAMEMSIPFFRKYGLPVEFLENKEQYKRLD